MDTFELLNVIVGITKSKEDLKLIIPTTDIIRVKFILEKKKFNMSKLVEIYAI